MSTKKSSLHRQMAEAYKDTSVVGRVVAVAFVVLGLLALFAYRAATTDPLWQDLVR